jgi:hypothetical protein
MEMELSDVSANENDNFGDYLWLLRHKLTQADTWEVQLRWGYAGMADADFVRGTIVEITSTSWDYAEMGRQMIPLRQHQAIELAALGDAYEANYQVQIWARRTVDAEAAGLLYLDCLCLLPIDEGWLKSWDFDLPAAATATWIFGEGPRGAIQALAYDGTPVTTYMASLATGQFRLPVGDGRLYIIYAGASAHDLTLGFTMSTFNYWERWANLRGSE